MIKPAHHPLYELFFRLYIGMKIKKRFYRHDMADSLPDHDGPLLMIGNHISWWDGFIPWMIIKKHSKRSFFLMMDEKQLSKNSFLRRLGAFSIRKNHRNAMVSLQFAGQLLQRKDVILVIFPQGRFESMYQHPLRFEKGWYRIMQLASPETGLVFMANLTDYLSHSKPTLRTYISRVGQIPESPEAAASAYNDFLSQSLARQQQWASNNA